MAEGDVELNRRFVEAFNTRDIEAVIVCFDPSIEFHSVFAAVGGAVYHRHDGMRRWYRDLEEAWGDEIRVEPEAYFDLGERTLAFYVLHGRGRHSGAEVAMPYRLGGEVARRPHGLLQGIRPQGERSERAGCLQGRAGADRAVMTSANVDLAR
jgi:hypothetical protein